MMNFGPYGTGYKLYVEIENLGKLTIEEKMEALRKDMIYQLNELSKKLYTNQDFNPHMTI
jgi:hypothetical protein